MGRRPALLLCLGLIAAALPAPAPAAEIHLKSSSIISGKIIEETEDSYTLINLAYRRGDGSIIQTTEGQMTIYKSDIELLVIDLDDRVDLDAAVPYQILKRGEAELAGPTPKEVVPEDDHKIKLIDIQRGEDDRGGKAAQSLWRPRKLGETVEVKELGVTITLPEKFDHEVVDRGGRKVFRAIAREAESRSIGFNLWRVKKHRVAPFDKMQTFFDFTQREALRALEAEGDRVDTVYNRRTPRKLPKLTYREAFGRTYLVEKGDDRRHIEVRILRTLSDYFVFVFSAPRDIDRDVMPIFNDSFASLVIPE